jgi:predicted O-methyltransferase YrrM
MKDRKGFPSLLKSMGLINKGVEVGSYRGVFAKEILNEWPGTLYLVDPWREMEKSEYDDVSNMSVQGKIYDDVFENLKGLEKRGLMMRMTSEQASELFPDKSLDFVYIDANHTYEHAKNDIMLWYPKVKVGGILAGHDFLALDCYNKESYARGEKNHPVWMWIDGNYDNRFYAGLFGVNPAVEEFLEYHGYDLQVTNEFTGTWWIVKKSSNL